MYIRCKFEKRCNVICADECDECNSPKFILDTDCSFCRMCVNKEEKKWRKEQMKNTKICVMGLWHLGIVTAACLANKGFNVVGIDPDTKNIKNLNEGIPPITEPGLTDLIQEGTSKGNLKFITNQEIALENADVLWIAFDTPVDKNDKADIEYVKSQVKSIFKYLKSEMIVIISSQLPVGSTTQLQKDFSSQYPNKKVTFVYSPENLRLGTAITSFSKPERIIVGLNNNDEKEKIKAILSSISNNIIWMSVESAEMTKHSLNAFLATSITFINEIASICEKVRADSKEVSMGLKTDPRIGMNAYLNAGSSFAGGTLARDIVFLNTIGKEQKIEIPLLKSIKISNDKHKKWTLNVLKSELKELKDKKVVILGLTYKPDTNTLRRSSSIELCKELIKYEVNVFCNDPSFNEDSLPKEIRNKVTYSNSLPYLLTGANAVVIATEWKSYKLITSDNIITMMKYPIVIDANRFLYDTIGIDRRIRYLSVGKGE